MRIVVIPDEPGAPATEFSSWEEATDYADALDWQCTIEEDDD